ncbi:hypothetical protein JKP88DRAFT_246443 [Tribonema minus]|uniref:Uncharacterized protein n=1 Tax=Tribonema minus TaxID=303371 RepID=A0A836CEG9_9STRA|nr:hypothetical protein JKP88DRAFT_246443 [Tribonema minus]
MGNALAACLQLIEQDPTWQGAHEDDGSGAEGEIEPACEPQDVCTWCFLDGIEPADLLACAACGVRADRDCARHATPADACSANEPWHCDACRWGLAPETLACALCGKRGAQNLLMRATACNGWVHRACAYWGETVEDTADDAFAKINPNCQE